MRVCDVHHCRRVGVGREGDAFKPFIHQLHHTHYAYTLRTLCVHTAHTHTHTHTHAVAKAREAFEPFIHQLGGRLSHVMRRLLPVTVFLLEVSTVCVRSGVSEPHHAACRLVRVH